MRTALLLSLLLFLTHANAQLVNGSFEDALGAFSDSGWVATCSTGPGPGAPGYGGASILVPHSNAPGCGWSRLYQLVTWFFINPYSGIRFGVKDAQGNLSFNTAALQNTGSWTFLSVTNTFSLAPGDTVFVECDPGTVSGNGSNAVWAMFDGLELSSLSTAVQGAAQREAVHLFPNPADDVLWAATDAPVLEARVITAAGQVRSLDVQGGSGGTWRVPVDGLVAGAYVLWLRTPVGVRTAHAGRCAHRALREALSPRVVQPVAIDRRNQCCPWGHRRRPCLSFGLDHEQDPFQVRHREG